MFKILVLQALHGLSDAQAEHRIRDRLSFMRFPGLGLGERIPDERTIRLFRERLVRAGAMDRLFDRFEVELENRGHLVMSGRIQAGLSGRILDASLVAAPRQRNGDAGKAAIKDGRIPEDWPEVWREDWTTGPARLHRKDRDACWRMKQGKKKAGAKVQLAIAHYGDRSHIATDSRHGLIRTREVRSAAAPDGKHLKGLLSKQDAASSVRADEAWMARDGFTSQVHHRKPPRKDLPAPLARAARPLARANARRSRVRSAVEHVLADRKQRMALLVRTIGLRRARIRIGQDRHGQPGLHHAPLRLARRASRARLTLKCRVRTAPRSRNINSNPKLTAVDLPIGRIRPGQYRKSQLIEVSDPALPEGRIRFAAGRRRRFVQPDRQRSKGTAKGTVGKGMPAAGNGAARNRRAVPYLRNGVNIARR